MAVAFISGFPQYKQCLGKLPHKQFHALIKKLKRKLKRQAEALVRAKEESEELAKLENSAAHLKKQAEIERELQIRLEFEEFNSKKKNDAWLQREAAAQAEFQRQMKIKLQQKLKREEQERQIKEEWEAQQAEEQKVKDEHEKKAKEKEKLLAEATASLAKDGEAPWHNPIVGLHANNGAAGTEKDKENCPFFVKTGACRFGDRCSRNHAKPNSSRTILIPGMYSHFSIDQSLHDEFDSDISLEYEDKDTFQHFKEFYSDVLPEFKVIGPLLQFKVCCNYEPHLRGNVYVQYESEADAIQAYSNFNGRWYGGRQLSCQFTNVTKWRSAICGLFGKKRCPKGKNCNFLHVFSNPDTFPGDYDDYEDRSRRREDSRSHRSMSEYQSKRNSKRSDRSHGHDSSRSSKHQRSSSRYSHSPSPESRSSRSSRKHSPSKKHKKSSGHSRTKHKKKSSKRKHRSSRNSISPKADRKKRKKESRDDLQSSSSSPSDDSDSV